MPELAEAEHFCRRWAVALGAIVQNVEVNAINRVFRGTDVTRLMEFPGARFERAETRGKQILFVFAHGSTKFWLGVHLGMAGSTRLDPCGAVAQKHDQLRLDTDQGILVFNDHRYFGRVRLHVSEQAPDWWVDLPPDLLSAAFTPEELAAFLQRRAKSPLKAVLLMQERFPGLGNWMVDEILWRARIRPSVRAGTLDAKQLRRLYREIRFVCRGALKWVAPAYGDPPATWLFQHRWRNGGLCPRCSAGLHRQDIGGRTTCWCAACQTT